MKKETINDLTTEKTELKREIGAFGGVSIIAGIMIGSGIFYLGAYVLQRVGMNSGLALLCWIIGGVISLFGGLAYAEMGAAMPQSGGRVVYLNEAYHPIVGFMNGFVDWLIAGPGSVAALALALMGVFQPIFHLSDFGCKIAAVVLIFGITAYNMVGVKLASMVQNVSMIAKMVPVAIILLAALFIGHVTPDLSLGSASVYAAENNTSVFSMIALAVVASLWAYEGWTNLNTVAGEMKKPKRDLPLAIILSMGFITLVYTLFNFAIYRVIPGAEIGEMISGGSIYLGKETAFRVMGSFGKWIVMIGMCVGIIGTVNGDCLVFPRTYYAMAKGGYFWKSFGTLNANGVPQVSMLWSSAIAIVLVIFNDLQSLTDLLITTSALLNMMAVIAVLIFRKKYPDMERPYKVWGGVPTIILTIIFFAVLLINNLVSDFKGSIIGFLIPVLCVPFYFYFRKKNGGVDYSEDNEGLE